MSEVIAPHGGIRHGAGNKKRPREGAKFCSDAATKRLPSRTNNDRSHLNLPIHAYAKQIIDSVKSHQVTVLVGETGSGKSTQLPQILLDHGLVPRDKGIVCTQPRRVAAVTIAQKVASERDVALGQEIGYSIRFEDKSSPATRIKYATDGVLLRECMSDDSLSKYHIVILDEAHERSLQTDILIGLLRAMQTKRSADSLRIIIMSATLQVESFQAFFQDCASVVIPGRQFPVDIMYLKEPESDYVEASLLSCLQIYEEEADGGVLVFLPGQEDIESLQQLLLDHLPTCQPRTARKKQAVESAKESTNSTIEGVVEYLEEEPVDFVVRVLYAAMPPEEQLAVFLPVPSDQRLFILATNIAETSLTISGVRFVVDTGYVKIRTLHPVTGFDMLKTAEVSQSQANQRAGRAGREAAGKCFRLYTEAAFQQLAAHTVPEVQRIDLAQVILQLLALGIHSILDFDWLTKPDLEVMKKALKLLISLRAVDESKRLTDHGLKMSKLPLHPSLSHFLLLATQSSCISEALTCVALLSAENLFLQPHRDADKALAVQAHKVFASRDGDLCTMINIYNAWVEAKRNPDWTRQRFLSMRALKLASNIRNQLFTLLQTLDMNGLDKSCWPEREPFLKCLAQGFYLHIAQKVVVVKEQYAGPKAGKVVYGAGGQQAKGGQKREPLAGIQQIMSIGGRRNESLLGNITAPYETLRGHQPVHIHPSSVLFQLSSKQLPQCVVYAELLTTTKQYMRNVSVVEASWLAELMPHVFSQNQAAPHSQPSRQEEGAGRVSSQWLQ